MRRVRNGLVAAGMPVENTKGEAETGQEELNIRYCRRAGRRPTTTRSPRTPSRRSPGPRATPPPSWRSGTTTKVGSAAPHPPVAVARAARNAFHDPDGAHGMSPLMRQLCRGLLRHCGRDDPFPRALPQQLQAVPARHLRADQERLVGRQPHRRLPACRRGHQGRAGRVPDRRRGHEPLSRLRRAARRRARRDRGRGWSWSRRSPAMSMRWPRTRRSRTRCRDALAGCAARRCCARRSATTVVDHYVRAAEWEQSRHSTACVTDWEIARGFERA